MNRFRSATKLFAVTITVAIAIATMPIVSSAQTPIKLHGNKFSASDDVKLGQEAAAEAEKQMQLVRDPELGVTSSASASVWRPRFRRSFNIPSFVTTSKSSTRKRSMRSPCRVGRCTSTAA